MVIWHFHSSVIFNNSHSPIRTLRVLEKSHLSLESYRILTWLDLWQGLPWDPRTLPAHSSLARTRLVGTQRRLVVPSSWWSIARSLSLCSMPAFFLLGLMKRCRVKGRIGRTSKNSHLIQPWIFLNLFDEFIMLYLAHNNPFDRVWHVSDIVSSILSHRWAMRVV